MQWCLYDVQQEDFISINPSVYDIENSAFWETVKDWKDQNVMVNYALVLDNGTIKESE